MLTAVKSFVPNVRIICPSGVLYKQLFLRCIPRSMELLCVFIPERMTFIQFFDMYLCYFFLIYFIFFCYNQILHNNFTIISITVVFIYGYTIIFFLCDNCNVNIIYFDKQICIII